MRADSAERPRYLVAISQPVVAIDLAEIIAGFRPGAEVCAPASAKHLPDAFRSGHFAAVILDAAVLRDASPELLAMISAQGMSLIVMGGDDLPSGIALPPVYRLDLPYSEDKFLELLEQIGRCGAPE